jgi:hypothetical protein
MQAKNTSGRDGAEPTSTKTSSPPNLAAGIPTTLGEVQVLEVSPFHQQVIRDLRWAAQEHASGRLDQYVGKYVAVLDQQVRGAHHHLGKLIDEVRQANPEVPIQRIALYYVDPGE